jgi:hypothetical protein
MNAKPLENSLEIDENKRYSSIEELISDMYYKCYSKIEKNILCSHGTREDVEDNLQSTFEVVAIKRLHFLSLRAKDLEIKIMGTSRNLWQKENEERENEKVLFIVYRNWLKTETAYSHFLKRKKIEILYRCFKEMKVEDRQYLHAIKKGLKNQEIADKYGYKIDTSKKRKCACINALRKAIIRHRDYFLIKDHLNWTNNC